MLHNNKGLFEQVILRTADDLGINPAIIEKDYYVTLFLKEIVKVYPDIIFKGGTSLSKCHKLIHRFSEDIDLNIDTENKPTEGQRKKLKEAIVQNGQLSSNMRERQCMFLKENPTSPTYTILLFCQRAVLMNGVVRIPDTFQLLNLKANLYVMTFSVFP